MERDPERDRLSGRVARFARVGAGLSGAAASFGANALFARGDAEARNARALKEALGRLKGPLMKVAQMFATVPDLLPPRVRRRADRAAGQRPGHGPGLRAPAHGRRARSRLAGRFGDFDLTPAAAASLGQVHRATRPRRPRPGGQAAVSGDAERHRKRPWPAAGGDGPRSGRCSSALDTREMVAEIAARLREELDYEHEARAMRLYRAFFADRDDIAVPGAAPRTFHRPAADHGLAGGAGPGVVQGAPTWRPATASPRLLFEAWWTPLTHIGVIHGDPHLGNYSFTEGAGRLNLLDFGCIRVFPPAFVGGVVTLFRALCADDRAGEAAAYRAWGFKDLTDDLMDVLGIWARFIYGPLLDDRVRTVADGVSPGAYGRREAFQVKRALDEKGPVTIPREFVFMDRAAIGLGAAFLHLGAELNWRRLFEASLEGFSEEALAERQAAALGAAELS